MNCLLIKLGIFSYWITWPGIWLILTLSPARTRAVVIADGKILLIKNWLGSGAWGLPGGGLRRGEEPIKGLIREVHEETGLNIDESQVVPLKHLEGFSENGIRLNLHGYTVLAPGQTSLYLRKPEVVEAGWFTLEDIELVNLQRSARVLVDTLREKQSLLE